MRSSRATNQDHMIEPSAIAELHGGPSCRQVCIAPRRLLSNRAVLSAMQEAQ